MEILSTIIGGIIGLSGALGSAIYTNKKKTDDKKKRLQVQLLYLIDLFERNMDLSEEINNGQKNIHSLILTSGIFILDVNYKDDLLFIELSEIDKQVILFWLKQWENIDEILSEDSYDSRVGYAVFKKKCPSEYDKIRKALPEIKEIAENKLK